MRISSSLFFQTGLNSINAQQSDLMHLFQQIGRGQRMVTPADDPLAAAQAINIRQAQSMNMRYAENREVAKQNLGIEENTLYSVVNLMQEIKTRLIEAGNGTFSDDDRMTLADVLQHARVSMLGLANATDGNGQYLFSGSKGDVMPFDELTGVYMGDTSQRNIQVDQTRQMQGSDNGSDIFLRVTPGVAGFLTAAGAGTSFDPATVNAGTGVISTAAVRDAAQLQSGYRFELTFVDESTYVISVYDADNAVVAPSDHPVLPDWTLEHSFIPGIDNVIQLPFGVQHKLSGHPVTGDIFSISPANNQDLNIFQTLDAMIAVLAQPLASDPVQQAQFQNVLASSMQRLDVNYDNILTVRASVGSRFNELDALDANGSLRNLGYRSQLSKLEDLDYYTATTQLELRNSALEAAALAFRKIQGTNLFSAGSGR